MTRFEVGDVVRLRDVKYARNAEDRRAALVLHTREGLAAVLPMALGWAIRSCDGGWSDIAPGQGFWVAAGDLDPLD